MTWRDFGVLCSGASFGMVLERKWNAMSRWTARMRYRFVCWYYPQIEWQTPGAISIFSRQKCEWIPYIGRERYHRWSKLPRYMRWADHERN